MKLVFTPGRVKALALVEVLVVTVVIAVLIGMVLPSLNQPHHRHRPYCSNNLKQVGLSFRLFATENGDQFPMNVSTNQGGSRDYAFGGEVFRHFQVMSNELSTPLVLVCPEDKRVSATNWSMLNNQYVSFFVGLESSEVEPQTLLSGDRNITNGTVPARQIIILCTNRPAGWTGEIHKHMGNVVLGDGSVQRLTSPQLRTQLKPAERNSQPIAIP
jgi:hypothetical protein